MKRIYEVDPRQLSDSSRRAEELVGLVGLGAKREALREARRILKNEPIRAAEFKAAVDAILIHGAGVKSWSTLVEAAYTHLTKKDKRTVRCSMLSFHWNNRNYEAAGRFITHRTDTELGLMELVFAWQVSVALGRVAEVRKIAKRLPRAIEVAEHPMGKAWLTFCLAEHLARSERWNEAIALLERTEFDDIFFPDVVAKIVEHHAAASLRVIRHGFQILEQSKKHFDPELATILPRNEDKRHQQAEREFGRLQKILERIVPRKEWKEWGVE